MTVRSAGGFADLVLADPAWLEAEFEAIVAANFGPPPKPSPPPRASGPSHPSAGRTRSRRPPRVRARAGKCPRRERSPPATVVSCR
ncbi:hypothetical protein [Amycolatopsis sp. MEPSY49]|uniref:hypothetical protein n=1 Tax=Amycolatopsis sp. MEPSY49 TaxID=3151600 RepID=UPI003EF34896